MAGPSDKARFYLEQSVSELNELERKKIFSHEEISSIAKKRSDFEHIINARGSHPSDYVRYIDFEKNVDALRRKRVKRLGVRSTGSAQRTIFLLYRRGVRKFPGDLNLWMQYIDFAKKEKAYKKLNDIFTSVVRLHSTNADLWIYAAHYFIDTQADITNARSYMQRGLRFCKKSEKLWLAYAKLETLYIGKIAGRRKILGLDVDRTEIAVEEDMGGDVVALPDVTAEDVNPSLSKDDGDDQVALQNLASAPVLTGAIPIAIFDSAMKEFGNDSFLAERFFDVFAEFDELPCLKRILQHVLDHLEHNSPQAISNFLCKFHMQLLGVQVTSPLFPSALRSSLAILDSAIEQHSAGKARLAENAIRRILPLIRSVEEMSEAALKKVLVSSLRKYCRVLKETGNGASGDVLADLVETLQREKNKEDAQRLLQSSTKQFAGSDKLAQLQLALNT